MKKLFLIAAGFVQAGCNFLMAQTGGLEGIIVEKYYISSAADTVHADSNAYLAPGSVTYRIYADLKPVYRIQAVYGVENHEMKIQTSTRFYNCKNSDGRSANDIHPANLTKGTGLLDSWVSMGAASLDYQGVMKTADDTAGNLVLKNELGILRNADPAAGIPLSVQDGMRFLRYQPATQFYQFDNDLHLFEYAWNDSVTGLIRTTNGAWASFGGSVGPQPDNQVLIAQLTTDGIFNFELNIQIATPEGGSEKYVARNPGKDENLLPSLIYSSEEKNMPPVVAVSFLSDPLKVQPGQVIKIKADVKDKDGKVKSAELYLDGKPVELKSSGPFVFEYTLDSLSHTFYVKATDDKGARSCSGNLYLQAPVSVN
jgi:hypothetical protein